MATAYSDKLRLALPVQGELTGTWGDTINDEITSLVEQAIAGLATIDTWVADAHTLTENNGAVDEARAMILLLTDTGTALSGAGELICPALSKMYFVRNTTGQDITVKTSAGTGVVISNNTAGIVFCDGTNVLDTYGGDIAALDTRVGTNETDITTLENDKAPKANPIFTGDVGINTASPIRTLHIRGANGIAIQDINNFGSVGIDFLNNSGTETASINGNSDSTGMTFEVLGSESMRIDSAGNVGIGTSSPDCRLDVVNTPPASVPALGATGNMFKVGANTFGVLIGNLSSGAGYIQPQQVDGTASGYDLYLNPNAGNVLIGKTALDADVAGQEFRSTGLGVFSATGLPLSLTRIGGDGDLIDLRAAGATVAKIGLASGGMTIANGTGTERMRIDANGDVLIGTTAPLASGVTISKQATGGIIYTTHNTVASATHRQFRNSNGAVGSITTSGSTTSYNTSSDYRLKTGYQPVVNASTRLQQLNPINFEWIADGVRVDGFLAHELAEVIPEAVTGEKDAVDDDGEPIYQGIDQSKIVPLLTAALQGALTEIEGLKQRVNALENS